jgi:hypothetical protein
MMPKIYSFFALVALATFTVSLANASSQTQIVLTNTTGVEIDLAWEEKDRILRVWTEFSNFNPNDMAFVMEIIQSETGKVVSESTINVMTNSENSAISFNTFVLYAVNAEDICQNDQFDGEIISLEECIPLTGQYEMQISTNDGAVSQSTSFTISDSSS